MGQVSLVCVVCWQRHTFVSTDRASYTCVDCSYVVEIVGGRRSVLFHHDCTQGLTAQQKSDILSGMEDPKSSSEATITHYEGDDCGHRESKKRKKMGVSGRSIKTQENRRQYA